ncbi:twin-arginine translocase TatA/TatE family subunit [bacterium]|nr:twin-arginine translocase TatA/TatE family subunit [bacterium]
MFGLGFSEIIVILIVALLVLGPDQLPTVAVKLGRFLAGLQRSFEDMKKDLKLDELEREIRSAAVDLKRMDSGVRTQIREIVSVENTPHESAQEPAQKTETPARDTTQKTTEQES